MTLRHDPTLRPGTSGEAGYDSGELSTRSGNLRRCGEVCPVEVKLPMIVLSPSYELHIQRLHMRLEIHVALLLRLNWYMRCSDVIISTIPTISEFVVTWGFIYLVNRQRMFLGSFCSSKRSSKKAWQDSSYFIAFTLHNVYPQHGGKRLNV